MQTLRRSTSLLCLLLGGASSALAQNPLPTTQPSLLTIVREEVKTGRGADHQKHEAGWPAAYAKSKSTDYYLAMAAMTGPNEVWYVVPFASHQAIADGMKRDDADPVLSAELARLSKGDAEYVNSVRTIQAAARPDLSMGDFPDLSKVRFWEITTFRVRPGHEPGFEAAAKAYRSSAQRSAPSTRYRVYEVIAGMPGPTYIIFGSMVTYGELDKAMADGQAAMKGANAQELEALSKFSREGIITVESNRFRLDPVQSFVAADTRASDPAFWSPKKAATKAATQPE